MKVLVTGGAGFIGSHLCDALLESGHTVTCLDNLSTSTRRNVEHLANHPRFDFWRHDVCDPFSFDCNQIYHLACPASPVQYSRNPVKTIRTGVDGTINALECARNTGARLLFTSTSEAYGDPLVHPQSERYYGNVNPIGPRSMYDEAKRCGEALCSAWNKQYGTNVRIARLFNCYGPRMAIDDGRLIPELVRSAMAGRQARIYGGQQTRSWCYVSDTVAGLVALLNAPSPPPVVNIGNPDERTVVDIAELISQGFPGKQIFKLESPQADDPRQRCPDITLAKQYLGWAPTVSLEAGIVPTITSLRHSFEVSQCE